MLDAIPVASAASAARTTGAAVARGRQRRERGTVQSYPALVKATPLTGSRARRRSTSKALSCRRRCGPTLHAQHELDRLRPDQQRASDGGRYHPIE